MTRTKRKPTRTEPPATTPRRPRRRHHIVAAIGVLAVALVLLGLSLSHLAAGVTLVTGSSARDGILTAIGIDLGFIMLEIAMLVADDAIRPAVASYASPTIIGTLATSAAMNALEFSTKAEGIMIYFAVALGIAIPAMIYALTKVGATLLFGNGGSSK